MTFCFILFWLSVFGFFGWLVAWAVSVCVLALSVCVLVFLFFVCFGGGMFCFVVCLVVFGFCGSFCVSLI